ncbi:MAG: MBL fold metallo-hydrolase [Nocardioidaceae bacterium]
MTAAMRLTVVGCAGSFPGPDSPASCYLLQAPHEGRTYSLLIDLGNGALGYLQRHTDLEAVDAVALSHLHVDHCIDLCSFYVFRKYHPAGPMAPIPVYGPAETAARLASAYDLPLAPGMSEEFDFRPWKPTQQVGPFEITAVRVDHPVEAYALRVSAGSRTFVYSGDTGPTDLLVEVARDADVFLCEASFVESGDNPPNVHLTGAQAGDHATRAGVGRLLLTHLPAWTDRSEVEADTKTTFDGSFEVVQPGATYDI